MSRSPEYYAAVFAVLEDADGRVLLLERTNTGWLDGSYGLPSGHVEPGEMPSEAMVREALEEVGVRPVEWTPFAVLFRQASSSDRTYSDFYFRVTRWE